MKGICKQCNKSFEFQKGGNKTSGTGTFCSRKCWGAWKSEHTDPLNKLKRKSCKVYFNTCAVCKKQSTDRIKRRTCSKECGMEWARRYAYKLNKTRKSLKPKKCSECGKIFIPEYGNKKRKFCTTKCCKKYYKRLRDNGNHRKRARKYGVVYEYVNSVKVFKRDQWHCQICGRSTPGKRKGTHYFNAPELDHRIPLSKGGGHLYSNIQCACRSCNLKKSNHRSIGQLPLFEVTRAYQGASGLQG